MLKIKIINKSEIIVIIQVNTEAQHIVFVIENLTCLMKFLQFFIKVQIMIIILSLKNQQMSLKDNFPVPIKKEIRKVDKDGN